jgi:hypothetical protein
MRADETKGFRAQPRRRIVERILACSIAIAASPKTSGPPSKMLSPGS